MFKRTVRRPATVRHFIAAIGVATGLSRIGKAVYLGAGTFLRHRRTSAMAVSVSRRQLLIAALAVSAVPGNARALSSSTRDRTGIGALRRRVVELLFDPPDNTDSAALDPADMAVLVAAAVALLDAPVEAQHYADYFSLRAEVLPGHRDLYRRTVRVLDRACNERSGHGFLAANAETRLLVSRDVLILEGDPGRLAMAWRAIASRERFLIDRHIGRPTLNLFEHTDLYRLLGYPSWPGLPTGYDGYLQFLGKQVAT